MGDWADSEDGDGNGLVYNGIQGRLTDRALRRARAAYYGSITHIDHQLGRFLQAMHDENVLNNTVILFVSDHGDMMGDHNFLRKSLPYKGSANVPLILYDPANHLGLRNGSVIDSVVELRDIMPTILEIANVHVPQEVEGQSLLPLAKGEDTPWREYLHGEHQYGYLSNHYIVTRQDIYIWFSQSGTEQYFSLEEDPWELHNAIRDIKYKERIESLRETLIRELKGREEGYTDGKILISGQRAVSTLSHIREH
jgi:arylsulfatase A-like enzyme